MASIRALFEEMRSSADGRRVQSLLQEIGGRALGPADLSAFHEALLFYKAYPLSEALRRVCERELAGFEARIDRLTPAERESLDQSGIVGTRMIYPYDLPMAQWLMQRLGDGIEIDWDVYESRDDDPLSELLPLMTPSTVQDALDEGIVSTRQILEAMRGSRFRTSLEWLADGFQRAFPSPLRDHLYNGMQLALRLTLRANGPSRTLADDGRPAALACWSPADRRPTIDLVRDVKKPLAIPAPCPKKRGQALLHLAYSTLLPRLRELYPAIHGNPEEVYDFPLERGVRIIVWFMKPARRLPLEAGWGLLTLRNGVPIGYGAGGMLEDRSEIAINVFDTFRGGEAAWLYTQYARIFYALGGASWLVTRKYQIGYENEEGISSGAYWFYDKLGFRSVDAGIRALADAERKKIARQKGYRSPRRVIKKLCQADIVLSLTGADPARYAEFPLGAAGLAAGRAASAAELASMGLDIHTADMTPEVKDRFAQMIPFLMAIPHVDHWSEADRKAALDLFRLKGSAREGDYARAMRHAKRFFTALRKTAAAASPTH
jgi:hypothetical protein